MKSSMQQKPTVKTKQGIYLRIIAATGIIGIIAVSIFFTISYFFSHKSTLASNNGSSQITNALRLDGVDEGVDVGAIDFGFTDELTLMAWIKWEVDPQSSTGVDNWANIISNNSTNTSDRGQFWLQHSNGNQYFEFAIQTTNGRRFLFSSTQVQQDVWTHVAGVYRNDTIRIYVNGHEENHIYHAGSIAAFQSDFNMFIGQWAHTNNSYRNFYGSLEDVGIYSRGLYPSEINSIMDDPNMVDTSDPDLQGFWTMDDNDGETTVSDISSNAIDGTITGGTAEFYSSDYPPLTNEDGTLPVDLTAFNADLDKNNVVLSWTTASESNSHYFAIMRSKDGENYEQIATVNAAGNSLKDIDYSYIDENLSASTYYYKLKQVDFDGKFEIFSAISITIDADFQVNVFPNPVKSGDIINIALNSESNSKINIQIFDNSGKLVYQNDIFNNSQYKIPSENFEKGTYIIKLSNQVNSEIRKLIII